VKFIIEFLDGISVIFYVLSVFFYGSCTSKVS